MGKKGPRGPKPQSRTSHTPRSTAFPVLTSLTTSDLLHLTLTTSAPPSARLTRFTASHRILLIGEGDFSFASALSTALGTGHNITATSYDSLPSVIQKYSSATHTRIKELTSRGVIILHTVDATSLPTTFPPPPATSPFDRIVFNFPHVGGSSDADILLNTRLLSAFFSSAQQYLSPNGQIHVSLRSTPFYNKWGIVGVGEEAGLTKVAEKPFEDKLFASLGYTPQRTNPAVRAAPEMEGAVVYIFERKVGGGAASTEEGVGRAKTRGMKEGETRVAKRTVKNGKTDAAIKPGAKKAETEVKLVKQASKDKGRVSKPKVVLEGGWTVTTRTPAQSKGRSGANRRQSSTVKKRK